MYKHKKTLEQKNKSCQENCIKDLKIKIEDREDKIFKLRYDKDKRKQKIKDKIRKVKDKNRR